jgi:hypothetical protein
MKIDMSNVKLKGSLHMEVRRVGNRGELVPVGYTEPKEFKTFEHAVRIAVGQ